MALFSLDNIIVESASRFDDSMTINGLTSVVDDENYSFLRESYAFVLDYTRDFNNANKTFFKNILESGDNQQLITESFSDFFAKAKEIIKKFIEFIKRIFKEFEARLHSIFKSEKYITKNKNEFAKFNTDDEFDYEGYEFSELYNHAIPVSDACDLFYDGSSTSINGYAPVSMNIADIEKYRDTTDWNSNKHSDNFDGSAADTVKNASLKKYVSDKYEELKDKLDDYYDWFRGHVIGKASISSSEYDSELKAVFRSGDTETTTITIDHSYVSEAYNRFDGYKKLIKSIEQTRKAIEKDYTKLRDALEKSMKFEKSGTDGVFFKFNPSSGNDYALDQLSKFGNPSDTQIKTNDPEVNNKIDMYIKAKVNQVQQMSSIHSLAFSAKLQAAKDCFAQDKDILYKALVKIKKHKPV